MWPFKPKEPKPPWMYLGWNEIKFADKKDVVMDALVIHFYARGDKFKERKIGHVKRRSPYGDWEHHSYMQKMIVPWLNGENVWGCIKFPSAQFKKWTKEHCGYVWMGENWGKLAEKIEGNVFKFPSKKDEASSILQK